MGKPPTEGSAPESGRSDPSRSWPSPQSQPRPEPGSLQRVVKIAANLAVRREFHNAYFGFVAAYRDAAEKLRAGKRDQRIPPAASRRRCRSSEDRLRLGRRGLEITPDSSRAP